MIVLVYQPTDYRPQVHSFDESPSREALQQLIDGDIEPVPGFNSITHRRAIYSCVAFHDKAGKVRQLPTNTWATALWHSALKRQGYDGLRGPDGVVSDWLAGNVAVVYREDDKADLLTRAAQRLETLGANAVAASGPVSIAQS